MKLFEICLKMASNMFSPFSISKTNIPLPGGAKMTALFRNNINQELLQDFIKCVDGVSK